MLQVMPRINMDPSKQKPGEPPIQGTKNKVSSSNSNNNQRSWRGDGNNNSSTTSTSSSTSTTSTQRGSWHI